MIIHKMKGTTITVKVVYNISKERNKLFYRAPCWSALQNSKWKMLTKAIKHTGIIQKDIAVNEK